MKEILGDVLRMVGSVEGFRYVAEDWGQLDTERHAASFPCALMDVETAVYKSLPGGAQEVDLTLYVRVADIRYNGLSKGMPERGRETELGIYDLLEGVNRALHGKGSVTYGPLRRVKTLKLEREDAIREFVITYKTTYIDRSAVGETRRYPVPPAITT